MEANGVLISWEGKPATLNFLTDVTERKQAQEEKEEIQYQLLQAQKMEAVGTLAGGVAHDDYPIKGEQLIWSKNEDNCHTGRDEGEIRYPVGLGFSGFSAAGGLCAFRND